MPGQRPKLNPKIKSIDDLLRINDEIQNQPSKQENSEKPENSIIVLPIKKKSVCSQSIRFTFMKANGWMIWWRASEPTVC